MMPFSRKEISPVVCSLVSGFKQIMQLIAFPFFLFLFIKVTDHNFNKFLIIVCLECHYEEVI